MGCLGIELGPNIHLSLPTLPRIAEFSYKVPFTKIYEDIFGIDTSKDGKHKENLECASNFSKALEQEVDAFAKKLHALIVFRDSRLLKNPEDFLRQESSKHGRVGREVNIKNETENENVKESKSVGKRAVVALIAIAAAVVSMLTTISSSIYFSMEMNGLKNYIYDVNAQLDSDAKLLHRVSENLQTLKKGEDVIGIQTDALYSSLLKLKDRNACELTENFVVDEVTDLRNHLNLVYTDIVSGKPTDRLFPISVLQGLILDDPTMDQSLLSVFPLSFYSVATTTLVKVDLAERTFRLVLTMPNVQAKASYVYVNFLTSFARISKANESWG